MSRHHRGTSKGHRSPSGEKTNAEWNSAAHDHNGPSQPNPPSVQKWFKASINNAHSMCKPGRKEAIILKI